MNFGHETDSNLREVSASRMGAWKLIYLDMSTYVRIRIKYIQDTKYIIESPSCGLRTVH
jgi:hypothetical protein